MPPNEVLDNLTAYTMGKLWEAIREIPGGTDDDRCGLALAVMAEILARSLASPDADAVAAITNMRPAERELAWRLVPVS